MNDKLLDAYRNRKLILFVGAGVSANLNIPDWNGLISHIASELGYDPKIFSTYGNHLALAEYYKIRKGGLGPLRSWMDREWHRSEIDISSSVIHKLIVQSNFPRIYTTNYDRWLEMAHDEFKVPYYKIADIVDIASSSENRRHIVKFHGDFDNESSIVLDETSYLHRFDNDSPLDIKLNNDILGNSVLFIGYSISDTNIRHMFYRLTKMWGDSLRPSSRPKSYVFTNRPNPVAEEVLGGWGIEMIVSEEDDPQKALIEFLQELLEK